MRSNFAQRGRGRGFAPTKPASRAPHASTAKIDSTELRNPSAVYAQAEALAQQHQPPATNQRIGNQYGRPAPSAGSSGGGSQYGGSVSGGANGNVASQTLSRVSDLAPFASGSSSSLFRTILKTPTLTQLYMHGSFQSNAPDVLRQFTAELRFFRTVTRHRNIVAFVGSLEGVGMLLEYVDGETIWKHLGRGHPMSLRADWFNQILSAVCHIHSFGLGHNDLCSLNVVITTSPVPPAQPPPKNPKYIVKLLDFGRSTIEPRPAPVLSALAALKAAQATSLHQRGTPSWEEKERLRKEREKDLILPGTRPFAAPEIMRAWALSEAGSSTLAASEEEDDDGFVSDDDDLMSESVGTVMDEDMDFMNHHSLPAVVPPLPLPLSTPAYSRDDDIVQQQHQQFVATTAGRSSLQSRMPILSFADNGQSSSAPIPAPNPSNDTLFPRSRFAPTRGRTGPLDATTDHIYPSPTSSPSHSQPSSPSDAPFAHDDAADVVSAELRHHASQFSRRDRRSQSRSRFHSRSATNSHPSTPTHYHPPGQPSLDKVKAEAVKKRRIARHQREIEELQSTDPHPLSTLLGDTYSLGVMALCLERDVLVDIAPHIQMREKWHPLDIPSPTESNRHALPIPDAQHGIAFFDGRFATSSSSSRGRNLHGKQPQSAAPTSLIERYMRPVRQREKCSKDDALDIDAIKEAERELMLQRSSASTRTPAAVSARQEVPVIVTPSTQPRRAPHVSPEMDFLMDDGGG